MTPAVHGTFTIERTWAVEPGRVFAAWADPETKARWFIGPPETWTVLRRTLNFRAGGQEVLQGTFAGGPVTLYTARYHDIVPNQRLIYVYDMHVGGAYLSTSLATVELAAVAGGTRMTFTEQATFLDGKDGTAARRQGTDAHFDRFETVLGFGRG